MVSEVAKKVKRRTGEPRSPAARFRFYDAMMRANKSVAGGRGGEPTKLDFGVVAEELLAANITSPGRGIRGPVNRGYRSTPGSLVPAESVDHSHERISAH